MKNKRRKNSDKNSAETLRYLIRNKSVDGGNANLHYYTSDNQSINAEILSDQHLSILFLYCLSVCVGRMLIRKLPRRFSEAAEAQATKKTSKRHDAQCSLFPDRQTDRQKKHNFLFLYQLFHSTSQLCVCVCLAVKPQRNNSERT